MCSGIMDHQQVSVLNLGKLSVDGEFIVIFTERSGDVIHVVTRLIFFSHHSNMVVSSVHRRTHQVDRTGIHADIFFVGVLFMDRLCHQMTVRRQHIAAQFRKDLHISHTRRDKYFIKSLVYPFTDHCNVIALLIRKIRDTNAA